MNDADHPTIKAAVEAVAARAKARAAVPITLLKQAHRWPADAEVTITAPKDERQTVLLLWDDSEDAWRAVFLPPGSEWSIKSKGPAIWTPKES